MASEVKVRRNWLKGMYILTIIIAGLYGLGIIIVPELIKTASPWPVAEPIVFGIVGSVYLAFGILSVFGLRDPLKFSPVLLLQLFYKVIWFIGVVIPLVAVGKFPGYAIPTFVIFAIFVIGDLIAIPFGYLFKKNS